MSRQTLRYRCITGRYVWLCMAVAIGLALGSQAVAAKECDRETPLPADVRLVAPGPEVPEAMARFAGVWIGIWRDKDREALCHTLVVEEVFANGDAWVISSYGTYPGWEIRRPGFLRVTGRIIDGELRFQIPLPDRPAQRVYRVAGETLQGNSDRLGPVSLTRVADVRQVGCRQPPPRATGRRDRLTAAELLATDPGTGLVHNDYFMPLAPSAPALHAFKGALTIGASSMSTAKYGCPADLVVPLPGFTVAFFTQGEHLVPAVRDIVAPPGIILSPGRVWSEPGDGGLSRASFPFVLTNPNDNATRNGLATFLYDDTRVSGLRFQVVQENVPWKDKYDAWCQAPLSYTSGPIPNEEALGAQFTAELQQQASMRPWAALAASVKGPVLENFDGDTAPDNLKVSGLIVDGVLYWRGCHTRAGPYPYCREMRPGVYSVTKSMGAAVALLRLAQTYGDQVFDLKIKDYVTVTAAHDGWERVTFANALNMATPIGDLAPQREPNQPFVEMDKPKHHKFLGAQTAREKLGITFSYGKYPWGPGEVLRYHNSNTFVLAAAMDSFLKRQAGPQAHLWDMVMAEVFQPIGIFHAPTMHMQERDGGRGIPLLAYGLYVTIDDVAKLTTLLQNDGQHRGQQLLSATKLAEALYKTEALGLPSRHENRFGEGRYHLSFWSVPYRTATGCFFQIPYMLGYGGNAVMLLPNGITAFRFADGDHYDVDTMVLAGEAIRPFPCAAGSGAAWPPTHQRQPLVASALQTEIPGHTFYGDPLHFFPNIFSVHPTLFAAADGRLYGTLKGERDFGTQYDVGTWQVTSDGHLCWRWHVRDSGRERCYTVYQEGETFELYVKDRLGKEVYRREPGNPEGY